jgi:hypothetical protein
VNKERPGCRAKKDLDRLAVPPGEENLIMLEPLEVHVLDVFLAGRSA